MKLFRRKKKPKHYTKIGEITSVAITESGLEVRGKFDDGSEGFPRKKYYK